MNASRSGCGLAAMCRFTVNMAYSLRKSSIFSRVGMSWQGLGFVLSIGMMVSGFTRKRRKSA